MPRKFYSGQADASGALVLVVTPTYGRGWRVSQVSVEMPAAPAGARCDLRVNGFFITATRPRGGVSSGDPYVDLLIGDELSITWAAGVAAAGAVGKATVFFELMGERA